MANREKKVYKVTDKKRLATVLEVVRRIVENELPKATELFGDKTLNVQVKMVLMASKLGYLRPLVSKAGLVHEEIYVELEAACVAANSLEARIRFFKYVRRIGAYIPAMVILIFGLHGILDNRKNASCSIASAPNCEACIFNITIEEPSGVQYADYQMTTQWSYYNNEPILRGAQFRCCPSIIDCCGFGQNQTWCDVGSDQDIDCPSSPWECSYRTDADAGITVDINPDKATFTLVVMGCVLLSLAALYYPLLPWLKRTFRRVARRILPRIEAIIERWKPEDSEWPNFEFKFLLHEEDEKFTKEEVVDLATITRYDEEREKGESMHDAAQSKYHHEIAMRPLVQPLFAPRRTLSEMFPKKYAVEDEPNPAVFMNAWELSKWHWPEERSSSAPTTMIEFIAGTESEARHRRDPNILHRLFSSLRRKTQRNEQSIDVIQGHGHIQQDYIEQFRARTPEMYSSVPLRGYRIFTRTR